MTETLASLVRMAYPGRAIILGRDRSGAFAVAVYVVTGRSASSQARRLEIEGARVVTAPTDPRVLAQGNPDLLVYPALIAGAGLAVSNGKQTADIDLGADESPVAVLDRGLRAWSFEPDAPIFTPRISGCVLASGRTALSIIKRGPAGEAVRCYYEIAPPAGKGALIATYAGENANPLPIFAGEPLEVGLTSDTPQAAASAVWSALRPAAGKDDFRVAVACAFLRLADPSDFRLAAVNRHERT